MDNLSKYMISSISGWWLSPTPLRKMRERQCSLITFMFQSTNQAYIIFITGNIYICNWLAIPLVQLFQVDMITVE